MPFSNGGKNWPEREHIFIHFHEIEGRNLLLNYKPREDSWNIQSRLEADSEWKNDQLRTIRYPHPLEVEVQ